VESNWVRLALRPPICLLIPGWLWWRNWWNDWQGKLKYSEKTCPDATLSTANPTCCPDANPGRRGGKPLTNRLSYGTAAPKSWFSNSTCVAWCNSASIRGTCSAPRSGRFVGSIGPLLLDDRNIYRLTGIWRIPLNNPPLCRNHGACMLIDEACLHR
jgi:hypothetical protein